MRPGADAGYLHDPDPAQRARALTQLDRHGPMMTEPLSALSTGPSCSVAAPGGSIWTSGVREIPPELLAGPFIRERAAALGGSSRMLQGSRFTRLHHRVWRHGEHGMTEEDWVTAARIALPADAHLTGITRLQQLGLDVGTPG